MAKKRKNLPITETRKYKSSYCSLETYITPLQYIVENICAAKARSENKDLPFYFWDNDEWKSYWSSQVRRANQLIKKYGTEAIIKTINKKRIYSLHPKWVEDEISKEHKIIVALEQAALKKLEEQKQNESDVIVGKSGRTNKINNNFSKLD